MIPPSHRRGFTLTELIAVVGILGVLVAFAMPMVGSMRAKSLTTKCVTNLRTLATAHHAYRADHQGKGPPNVGNQNDPTSEGYEFTEGHTILGINMLRAYYREGVNGRYNWTTAHQSIPEKTEQCLSDVVPGDTSGYMMTVLFGENGRAGAKSFTGFFANPAQTPLLWDGYNPGSGNMRQKIPLRHSKGINMAFLDGHVEYLIGTDRRLYNDYFDAIFRNGTPDTSKLGAGAALGVSSLP